MESRVAPPADVLWRTQTLVWVFFLAGGLALLLTLARGPGLFDAEYFGLTAVLILWVLLLALTVLYLFRSTSRRLPTRRLAVLCIGVLILCSWSTGWLVWVALPEWIGPVPWPGVEHPGLMSWRMAAIAAAAGALGLVGVDNYLLAKTWASRAQLLRLEALQARTRPHFLFNTLNTAVSLVRQKPGTVEALLLNLSDLFRAALASSPNSTLHDEIELTRKYIEIETERFGARLALDWDLPEPLPALRMPRLALQPLVENAVLHGIERRPEGGRIEIRVRADAEQLHITVRNDLPQASAPPRVGHHIGLEAVRARVDQFSQGSGRLEVEQDPSHYTARLLLPSLPVADAPGARPSA